MQELLRDILIAAVGGAVGGQLAITSYRMTHSKDSRQKQRGAVNSPQLGDHGRAKNLSDNAKDYSTNDSPTHNYGTYNAPQAYGDSSVAAGRDANVRREAR